MDAIYASPDLTAFVGSHVVEGRWHAGTVTILMGAKPARLQHECLPLRDTPARALRDAHRDAKALIAAWHDKVRV